MTITTDITLSDEQRAIVDADVAALVVFASAGTGKTEVVAQYVERLLSGDADSPSRILALSYTNKASNELRDRFHDRLGAAAQRVDTLTLHAFAHDLLRKSGTWIGLPAEPELLVRDEDRVELLSQALEQRGQHEDGAALLDRLRRLDLARARCEPLAQFGRIWQEALEAAGVLDYEACLERAADLLDLPAATRRLARLYTHIVVDEAQNLTPSQYRLLTGVFGSPPLNAIRVMLVGDDKQALLRFGGSDRQIMSRFAKDYNATTARLLRNYRSAERIVAAVNNIATKMGQTTSDPSVHYAASGAIDARSFDTEESEGDFVGNWVLDLLKDGLPETVLAEGESARLAPKEIAVLGRSAASLRATQRVLVDHEVRVTTSANMNDLLITDLGRAAIELIAMKAADHMGPRWQLGRLLGTDEATVSRPVTLRAHLVERTDDFANLTAIIDLADPSDIVDTLDQIGPPDDADWHGDRLQIQDGWRSYAAHTDRAERGWGGFRLFLARIQRNDRAAEGVRLLTIAKSQGREYRAVALVGLNDGQLPDFRATTPDQLHEELSNFTWR